MIRSVLTATDLSEASDESLRAAAALAAAYGAELHVLHAAPRRERRREERLEVQVRRALKDIAPATMALVVGDPPGALLAGAAACGADLLVLGPHRPRGTFDTLLGSTAESVVRRAPLPCLVVNRPFHAPPRRIVVATDLSAAAAAALERAVRWFGSSSEAVGEAEGRGTSEPTIIEVLHVTEPGSPAAQLRALEPRLRAQVDEAQRHLDLGPSVKLRPRVMAAASAAHGIENAAEQLDADVVVLGTRGQHALSRALVGSAASAVMRTVPFPLLLVPPAGR